MNLAEMLAGTWQQSMTFGLKNIRNSRQILVFCQLFTVPLVIYFIESTRMQE